MTSKEFVKSKYPKANAERFKSRNPFGGGHYLIWSGYIEKIRLGEGETESKAWVNAKENLINHPNP